jgi:hypothetical protein
MTAYQLGDFTWLWVMVGIGAFVTVVATLVYALASQPTDSRPRTHTRASQLDGSHERLPEHYDADHVRTPA